jgi:hypothetical protein
MIEPEGWYEDPYGLHEARWISGGTPTALVRDGAVEAQDEPPADPPTTPFVPVGATATVTDGEDLLRADDPEVNGPAASRGAFSAFDEGSVG